MTAAVEPFRVWRTYLGVTQRDGSDWVSLRQGLLYRRQTQGSNGWLTVGEKMACERREVRGARRLLERFVSGMDVCRLYEARPADGRRLVNADAANAAASSMIKLSTPTELPCH